MQFPCNHVLATLVLADLVTSDLVLPDLVRTDLVHASLDLAIPDMHCNLHIHDLDLQDNPDFDHSFEGPLDHLSSVHKIQKRSVQEGECEYHYQLSFRQQLSSELVSALLFPFLLLLVAQSLASQYLWVNYLQHPEPKCSEFIPSALVWLLGPWLLPGNIAFNYTTRGAQPLRYHAKSKHT